MLPHFPEDGPVQAVCIEEVDGVAQVISIFSLHGLEAAIEGFGGSIESFQTTKRWVAGPGKVELHPDRVGLSQEEAIVYLSNRQSY